MSQALYNNEQIKRKFFVFLKESKGFADNSIEDFRKSILVWQDFTKGDDFANFGKQKVIEFKSWLKNKPKANSQDKVSLSYCYDTFRRLRAFFDWLSKQSGYKSKINSTYVEFLRLSKKESRIAIQGGKNEIPSLDEVKQVIEDIGNDTEIDMRDRVLICFTLLTGARISAIMSLPLKSFDENTLTIDQDPKLGVKTKFSKRIVTTLFPLADSRPLEYFLEWIKYLKSEKQFKPADPIFPATKVEQGRKNNLSFYNTKEVEPVFWQSATSARTIFEKRFKDAGVKYYHPHTLRHLIVKEFTKTRLTEEEKKAISQNLGHENVGTTFGSYGYGKIEEDKQIEIVRNIKLGDRQDKAVNTLTEEKLRQVLAEELKKNKSG